MWRYPRGAGPVPERQRESEYDREHAISNVWRSVRRSCQCAAKYRYRRNNAAAGQAQPYFGAATGAITGAQAGVNPINQAATGLMGQSAEQVNPTNLDAASIDKYLSPYLNTVLGSTESLINQQNQQAQAGQMGTAIQSGAFGGDRSGIAAANLSQQQELAAGNIYSGIANQGYQSALGTAQQQQGVNLAAGQANRAALANAATGLAGIGQTAYGEGANTATTLAGLGTGAQGAALQGAQAQIGAGTLQQQTQQAQDTAQYNQFLQQQSYPFQVDQFLANIAEGTGALSGSTTTTTQPGGFFSDRRLKHDIKKIGKTYDGQHIYSYKMHGDDRTHIGLIAQDVEKKHPEATGVSGHYKVVDYGKATEDAANRGHFYSGGVVPIRAAYAGGGNPMPQYAGMPSAVSPMDLSAILQAQQAMYAPYSGGKGLYGNEGGGPYGGVGHVPPPSGAVSHLVTPQGGLSRQPSVLENTKAITDLVNSGRRFTTMQTGNHRVIRVAELVTTRSARTSLISKAASFRVHRSATRRSRPMFRSQASGAAAARDLRRVGCRILRIRTTRNSTFLIRPTVSNQP